jgi:hypothetical protein
MLSFFPWINPESRFHQLESPSGFFVTIFYHNAAGVPFKEIRLPICYEDIAAEEKARSTYQWIINASVKQSRS